MTTSTIATHAQTAQELLAKSDRQFAAGEYREGSETLWRSAELAMTAVARQRGWKHGDYKELKNAAKRFSKEIGDKSIYLGFSSIRIFYENAQYGFLDNYEIDLFKLDVPEFVHRVLAIGEDDSPSDKGG